VPVPLLTEAIDLAVRHIQSGEQSSCAVGFVVVRHGRAASAFQGQPRLRTVQSLNLALLVHAQHQRVLGRIQVQTDDVFQFLGEPGSLLIVKVSTRCGFKPWARQMRRTLASLMPTAAAIVRVLQCVALRGCWRVVMVTTRCVRRALIVGLRPGRDASYSTPLPPAR
jgi:hypothetical protein